MTYASPDPRSPPRPGRLDLLADGLTWGTLLPAGLLYLAHLARVSDAPAALLLATGLAGVVGVALMAAARVLARPARADLALGALAFLATAALVAVAANRTSLLS